MTPASSHWLSGIALAAVTGLATCLSCQEVEPRGYVLCGPGARVIEEQADKFILDADARTFLGFTVYDADASGDVGLRCHEGKHRVDQDTHGAVFYQTYALEWATCAVNYDPRTWKDRQAARDAAFSCYLAVGWEVDARREQMRCDTGTVAP